MRTSPYRRRAHQAPPACPGPLAQLAEQRAFNPWVLGSNPRRPTDRCGSRTGAGEESPGSGAVGGSDQVAAFDADLVDECLEQGFAGVVVAGVQRVADPPAQRGQLGVAGRGDDAGVEVGLQAGAAGAQVAEAASVALHPLPADGFGQRAGLERAQVAVDRRLGLGDLRVGAVSWACSALCPLAAAACAAVTASSISSLRA